MRRLPTLGARNGPITARAKGPSSGPMPVFWQERAEAISNLCAVCLFALSRAPEFYARIVGDDALGDHAVWPLSRECVPHAIEGKARLFGCILAATGIGEFAAMQV